MPDPTAREAELTAALSQAIGYLDGLSDGLILLGRTEDNEDLRTTGISVGSEVWRLRKVLDGA